jgi:GTP cyclohydrolase II
VRAGESLIQTKYGEFRMIAYESEVNGGESHIALVRGELCPDCPALHGGPAVGLGTGETRQPCPQAVLVRVHTRCTAGDVFDADCKCRETLDQSMRMIAEEGCGAVLYLHNTSRGFEVERTPVARAGFEPGGAAVVENGCWAADHASGAAVARRFAGADGANLEGDWAGRADSVRPRDTADSVAVEHADAHSGAGGIWAGDCGAGADSYSGVRPGEGTGLDLRSD